MSILADCGFDLIDGALTAQTLPDSLIGHLIGELTDSASLWYDLKLAEMSGSDYIFAPDAACRQLYTLRALESFLLNVHTLLGSKALRTVLVSYWHDRGRQLHFEKYHVEWANGVAINWHKELLDNSPQQEFVEVLYEHSEKLILEA